MSTRTSATTEVTATTEVVTTTGVAGRTLALTFDDGPDPRATPRLLDLLGEHDVRAVWCLWGEHVEQHPDLVRRAVAEGHRLGCHTHTHPDLGSWSARRVEPQLRDCLRAVAAAAPGAAVPWYRAPYGRWGTSPAVAAALGLQPLGWQVDVEDWDPPGVDVLLRRLQDRTAPGAVVLLHDGGGDRSRTVDALARYLPWLRAQGYAVVLPRRPADAGRTTAGPGGGDRSAP